ncbi:hypothetical protein [Bradyrhizobium vignae]
MAALSFAAAEICQGCPAIHLQRKAFPMLHYYIKTTEAMKRLRADQEGVVSFEYIIVAVCIVGAVGAVFGGGAGGQIGLALQNGIGQITATFANAIAG